MVRHDFAKSMLYTQDGDDGKTVMFCCDQRISKSSIITEALGCLDEINSYLGIIKSKDINADYKIFGVEIHEIIHRIQNNLFVIQAEVAGAYKKIKKDEVKNIEEIINKIEKELPPIKTFLVSGANEMSANFDVARTLARRAERRVVAVNDEGIAKIDSKALSYINRLSSLLYALARYFAKGSGVEVSPKY